MGNTQITMKFALVVCFAALAAAEPEAKADPWLTYGYAGYPYAYGAYRGYYGHPYAYYGKRSADAEPKADADAFYGYYGYGVRPYAYGKRSADAEPAAEPKADADAYYGYYGYGRPYAYGYRYGGYRGYYWG